MSELKITPITAAGGVVFNYTEGNGEPRILMIYRNGYWDLPKGKLESDENLEMCAVREVAEEVGSSIPAIVDKIGTTYHEYPERERIMGKTTHWYSLIFTKKEDFKPQMEEGIEKVEWFALRDAIEKAGFENLKQILRLFRDSVQN